MRIEPERRLQVFVDRHESGQVIGFAADTDSFCDDVVGAGQVAVGKGKVHDLLLSQRITSTRPDFGQPSLREREERRESRASMAEPVGMIENESLARRDAVVLVAHAGKQHRAKAVAQKVLRGIGQAILQSRERGLRQHRRPPLPADVNHPDRAAPLQHCQRKVHSARTRPDHRDGRRHLALREPTARTAWIGNRISEPMTRLKTADSPVAASARNAPAGRPPTGASIVR
jgi:hypothetical protein